MSKSIAENLIDAGQLAALLGLAYGVFLLWKNRAVIADVLNPFPEIDEWVQDVSYSYWEYRAEKSRILQEDYARWAARLRSIIAPSPGYQLSDLYAHIADIGPLGGSQFTTGYEDGTATL